MCRCQCSHEQWCGWCRNGDGTLDKAEITRLLELCGFPFDSSQIDAIIAAADTNGVPIHPPQSITAQLIGLPLCMLHTTITPS